MFKSVYSTDTIRGFEDIAFLEVIGLYTLVWEYFHDVLCVSIT